MEKQNNTDKIFFHGKEYFCTLDLALDKIGGKWKIIMIYMLQNGALRSSDLQRKMSGVSNKISKVIFLENQHQKMSFIIDKLRRNNSSFLNFT